MNQLTFYPKIHTPTHLLKCAVVDLLRDKSLFLFAL